LRDKWRPRIRTVVLAILLTVMALPLVGLFFFRLYENQLIRQTESELIAQGAVIAAIYAGEIRNAGVKPDELGTEVVDDQTADAGERYRPIEPQLDLAVDPVLEPRPNSVSASPDAELAGIGEKLSSILAAAQQTTLAGYRLLDHNGVVIAGGGEIGRSLAHVDEVRAALSGSYASVLRKRVRDEPDPSLYSISRGTKVRVFVAMPVVVDNKVAGAVYLSRTPSNIVKHLYGERWKVLLAAITVLGTTLLIAFVFVRTISQPIHELIGRTARIAAGDRDAIRPLSHHGTQEMAELAAAFLDMARKLQARSDTIQTFATHVSHELKSPLTSIQGAAELLRDAGDDMDRATKTRFHDNIVADADRMNRLVRRLIELARAESSNLTSETSSLAEALNVLERNPLLSTEIDGGADLRFRMSPENAAIVLANLIDNSARHGAGRFSLSAATTDGSVAISAGDDGPGISPSNRARIFEPFFTTRRDTGGTGMGLGIVAALIKAHEGSIRLVDTEDGARFDIRLPAA
jgi:signal transduction histidine kinase